MPGDSKIKLIKMALDIITVLYAFVISAGGVVGFVKAGSVPSLAMGLVCGILMIVGAVQTGQDEKNITLSLVTSAVLTGVMGYRFSKSRKVMPAGLVAALSFLMVLKLGYTVLSV